MLSERLMSKHTYVLGSTTKKQYEIPFRKGLSRNSSLFLFYASVPTNSPDKIVIISSLKHTLDPTTTKIEN